MKNLKNWPQSSEIKEVFVTWDVGDLIASHYWYGWWINIKWSCSYIVAENFIAVTCDLWDYFKPDKVWKVLVTMVADTYTAKALESFVTLWYLSKAYLCVFSFLMKLLSQVNSASYIAIELAVWIILSLLTRVNLM